MNDPSCRRDRLVGETFHDDWDAGPVAGLALQAARAARRHRRRQALLGAAGIAVALTVTIHFVGLDALAPADAPPARSDIAPAPSYEVISDAELLALVQDRPLLFVKEKQGAGRVTVMEN